ncbi:MAG: GTP-binding protein [Pseudomonadota bacterium]|nr:GTP-binding protein [Pseudomonadota bacterium]
MSAERLAAVDRKIRHLNPMATIHHTRNGEIDLGQVLNVRAFDLEAKLQIDGALLDDHTHEHDATVRSFVLKQNRPIDINRFMLWMNGFAQEHGDDLFRTKGIFYAWGFRVWYRYDIERDIEEILSQQVGLGK